MNYFASRNPAHVIPCVYKGVQFFYTYSQACASRRIPPILKDDWDICLIWKARSQLTWPIFNAIVYIILQASFFMPNLRVFIKLSLGEENLATARALEVFLLIGHWFSPPLLWYLIESEGWETDDARPTRLMVYLSISWSFYNLLDNVIIRNQA